MKRNVLLTVLTFGLLFSGVAAAQGWKAKIVGHPNLPPKFLTVDKNSQRLSVYAKQSPVHLISTFPCTTGQSDGDKQVEDDLRTPEGVYFVQGRKAGSLDWELYGNLAYPLNYPNPVDRLKGKTGYGIWIHGRGKKLVPRDTRGCVAMNTKDLRGIGGELETGLPVVISEGMSVVEGQDTISPEAARDLDEAVALVRKWADAWQRGSDEFFGYYDAASFGRAENVSFSRFRSHKEGLFKRYPWIRIMAHDIRALPGPDYVVTFFRQYYRTPTMASEGVKRLYWMRDEAGRLRIVGREWKRTRRTLDGEFLARSKGEIAPLLEAWRKAWERGDLADYMTHYTQDAAQGDREGAASIRDQKKDLWSAAPPSRVAMLEPKYNLVPQGVEVVFGQSYTAQSGYEDHGIKTMLLVPDGSKWKILREDWRPL